MVIGNVGLRDLIKGYIGPASVDVTLSDTVLVQAKRPCAVRLGGHVRYIPVKFTKKKPFILMPGAFVLAATKEVFQFPVNVCGFVQGRSSIGRIGLTVQNAGFIDPGFHGTITLELVNEGRQPIALIPDYRIAQIIMLDVRDNDLMYEGKYNGQIEPVGSRMYLDREVQA